MFEEGAKARFIDDVFDARRQGCPCTFQHLETSSLETLQQKFNVPPPQNQTNAPQKFYHNLNFSHVHTQLPKIFHSHAKKFLLVQNSHTKIPMHPKKSMSHNKKSMPHQNVTTTKFYHNQNF